MHRVHNPGGADSSDVMIRLQDKEIDQQNISAGTRVELSESQKRIRIPLWQVEQHRLYWCADATAGA